MARKSLSCTSPYVPNPYSAQYSSLILHRPQFPESEDQPPYLLRGFDKLDLAPGKSKTATFELTRKDLSVWDVYSQQWESEYPSILIILYLPDACLDRSSSRYIHALGRGVQPRPAVCDSAQIRTIKLGRCTF